MVQERVGHKQSPDSSPGIAVTSRYRQIDRSIQFGIPQRRLRRVFPSRHQFDLFNQRAFRELLNRFETRCLFSVSSWAGFSSSTPASPDSQASKFCSSSSAGIRSWISTNWFGSPIVIVQERIGSFVSGSFHSSQRPAAVSKQPSCLVK